MNALVKAEPKMMLLDYMADRYALNVEEFTRTVKATCGLVNCKPEEFAAFLLVAKEYSLNPLTKEIYAFAGRGGGIVPIVSIDGWVNLVNSHGKCDGFDFEMDHDDNGELVSCTCRMYRKDRTHPVVVTEYLDECKRNTDPWKMKHRMLRHKAMIQAARYAFGFSGVYDEDEGRTIAESGNAVDVTPRDAGPPRRQIAKEQPKDHPEQTTESVASEQQSSGEPPADFQETAAPDATPRLINGNGADEWSKNYLAALRTSTDSKTIFAWVDANQQRLDLLAQRAAPQYAQVKAETERLLASFREKAATEPKKRGRPSNADKAVKAKDTVDPEELLKQAREELAAVTPDDDLDQVLLSVIEPIMAKLDFPGDKSALQGMIRDTEKRLGG